MPRAIIYPHLASDTGRGQGTTVEARAAADGYLDRLGKHVAGEALAVFLLINGRADLSQAVLSVALVVIALGAVLYRRNRNARLPAAQQAHGVIYDAFTIIAFLAWALGTSQETRNLFRLGVTNAVVIMALVAFLLPAVDEALGRRLGR